MKTCKIHNLPFSLTEPSKNRYRCLSCKTQAEREKYRKLKQSAADYLGSKCNLCGYFQCLGALEFHHLDTAQKEFEISSARSKSLEDIKQELDKCILLCSNCHKEIHSKER